MVTEVLSAALGALLASWVIEREARRTAALQLMASVEAKLSTLRPYSLTTARRDVHEFYSHARDSLTPAGAAYLDYLSALDFLLYCIDKNLVLAQDARFWVRGLLAADPEELAVVKALQDLSGTTATFEFLRRELSQGVLKATRKVG